MAFMVVGVLAEALAALSLLASSPGLAIAGLVLVALGALGVALVAAGRRRQGASLVLASGILYIPLGLIAIHGARQVLNADDLAALEARRRSR
jgi:hypothetical protein